MSETFDLRIDSIAAGGDGVGRRDGMVVFVPRSAPGDRAQVTAERHDRLMRGRIVDLIEPSPRRVDPPCKHYVVDRCGGCQLQHLSYDAQLEAKAAIVRDAIVRIGRVDVEPPAIAPSDKEWRYRTKLTLALRFKNGRWIAGLHRYDTRDVFVLDDCPITEHAVLHAWTRVLDQQHLLPRTRPGERAPELRGTVRVLDGGFSFTLEGARHWPTVQRSEFFSAIPGMLELWWKPQDDARRLLESRQTGATGGGASFTQVNPGVAAQLRACVVSLASAVTPATAIDAYAGTGEVAVALARQGVRVVAIEVDRDAARVAGSALPEGSRAVAARVEETVPNLLPADVVILNPPRAGVDASVTQALNGERTKSRALIYVSCNPATLARDLRRLDGYRVQSLRAFDMFPQTAHVETVCELVPVAAQEFPRS